jgi:hypothetical protein
MLGAILGCDGGGEDPGPKAVGGAGGSTGMLGGSSGSGGGALPEGVALTPMEGWVPMDGNSLGIQGAMFAYADPTSKMTMMENFAGSSACISGEASKVIMPCTFMPPATDCYGEYWGVAIGLNLNQPTVEMDGKMVGGDPMAYDASGLKGFAFNIDGTKVPTSLRFTVESTSGDFCTPPATRVAAGPNTFMFEQLFSKCWEKTASTANPNAGTVKNAIKKIAWQVVTNDKSAVPYEYCVSDVRALPL